MDLAEMIHAAAEAQGDPLEDGDIPGPEPGQSIGGNEAVFSVVKTVVVPKRHVPSFVDLGDAPDGLPAEVIEVVRQVAADVEARHGACRVLTNVGRYQDSKHIHFHVNSGPPREQETD